MMANPRNVLPPGTMPLLLAFLVVLLVPFVMRPESEKARESALPLIIISPHNEAIRHEFSVAFSRWHRERYGKPVEIDWRSIGGTSEIVRYLSSQYAAAFRAYWQEMGKEWTLAVASNFNNPKVELNDDTVPEQVREARRLFLQSNIGVGLDLFFGGGQYDHAKQAAMGHSVPCGYRNTAEGKATLDSQIPETIGGEAWYDPEDRWYGATVSSFGICYNADALSFLDGVQTPSQWRDLCQPGLFGTVALADPTKSGSINKAFEMVIQQEMANATAGLDSESQAYREALAKGWTNGLNVIRMAAANSRYFTDSASQVTLDVAMADAAVGMCIDFYGQFQAESVARPDGSSRMHYVSPLGGTTVSCDPIAMLRGARNKEIALRFIVFTLSLEGQRLWGCKAGTPGGPEKYTLHRIPIRRDFYTQDNLRYASDAEVDPYRLAGMFTYHAEWTGRLFGAIRLLIRTMCLDAGEELREAWKTVLRNGGPEQCVEAMEMIGALPPSAEYWNIQQTVSEFERKTDEVKQARLWGVYFANRYREACRLCNKEKGGRR